jgi:GNAT superfamily N-acetyltransferase
MTKHAIPVRLAEDADGEVVARLLDQFNREFDEPSPGPTFLAARVVELMHAGETDVLLGGAGPDGVAVLRFRPSLWTSGTECFLAELFVTPERRGNGVGRAIMNGALAHARRRGADYMHIGVDEPDMSARNLYESLGFTNRTGGPDGPLMFFYERDL